MFLKKTSTPKGVYLQYVESYWNGNTVKQRVIKKLGYVDDLKKEYNDPISYFSAEAKKTTAEKKQARAKRTVEIDPTEEISEETCDLWNVGYGFIKRIYKELELDKFWKSVQKGRRMEYDLDEIFQLLVYSRILYPGSKRSNYFNQEKFFGRFGDISLDDIYNAMDIYAQHEEALQKWIYDHSKEEYKCDLSIGYFDCTNYYFDISKPDLDELDENGQIKEKKLRKRGPEKNHRPDPIVEMGLLMDKNCIPVAYNLFPGNESEKLNMLPIVRRVKREHQVERIIVVADRGLNTSDTIFYLNGNNKGNKNHRDGYIYGQSVRGADAEFKAWVLNQSEYEDTAIQDETGGKVGTFRHKSRIYPRKLEVHEEKNNTKTKKIKITVDQKQMVYYSEKYAKKQKFERDIMVARAKDLINHPKKYDRITAKGAAGYVLNISFNKETGEVVGKNLALDEAKIAEEEKYDGYYSIVSSELNMNDMDIRKAYRGLIHIEDTFKVTKTNLEARPVFHWTTNRIKAHFMSCYAALVILRLMEKKLDNHYTLSAIIASLRECKCTTFGSTDYKFVYVDNLLKDLGGVYGINMKLKYRTRNELRRFLKY